MNACLRVTRLNVAGLNEATVPVSAGAAGGSTGAGKWALLSLALVAAMALPLGASARGAGGHGWGGGYSGNYYGGAHGNRGVAYYNGGRYGGRGHDRGGHWSGGRWIAGAIVAGAVIGLINEASRPAPVYYDRPVVYSQPRVVYDSYYPEPVVRRRVVTRTVVYDDPYQTRYIRSDGYDD